MNPAKPHRRHWSALAGVLLGLAALLSLAGAGYAAGADRTPPALRLPKTIDVDKARRYANTPLTCPANERRCYFSLSLRLTRTVNGKRRTERLGGGHLSMPGRRIQSMRWKLTQQGRAAMAGRTSRKVTVVIKVRDAAGNSVRKRGAVTLRLTKY